MPTEINYVQRAKAALHVLLASEHALVEREATARLGEHHHASSGKNLDPHVTGLALRELARAREILLITETTKGGHRITTIQPADRSRRGTAIDKAAARKRALYARYLGWATGTVRHRHGLIGPSAETATRAAIIASAALQPATRDAGQVSKILGVTLPGAADSGGYINPIVNDLPQPPVTVLIEIKSIRDWIYPSSSELFQVLHKCVLLKQANPTQPVVPILVCRRAHKTSFWMAKQLGFVIIDMQAQYLGDSSDVDEEALREVRSELGFLDLRLGAAPNERVRDRFSVLAPHMTGFAASWTETSGETDITELISHLRRSMPWADRDALLNELRANNLDLGRRGGW